jgi:hypothetical protein
MDEVIEAIIDNVLADLPEWINGTEEERKVMVQEEVDAFFATFGRDPRYW